MTPFDPLVGEFRVHYAGFFDPGFGAAEAGGAGSRAVLEVRSHDVPFILEDGQIVGRLVYERMAETPRTLYGAGIALELPGAGPEAVEAFQVEGGAMPRASALAASRTRASLCASWSAQADHPRNRESGGRGLPWFLAFARMTGLRSRLCPACPRSRFPAMVPRIAGVVQW